MAGENFLWGAPRIHGKLLMLGFSVSEASHACRSRNLYVEERFKLRGVQFVLPQADLRLDPDQEELEVDDDGQDGIPSKMYHQDRWYEDDNPCRLSEFCENA